ncbi:lipopolysaccharide heptosyltransferase II [Zooshikella marina]|nr:lipopolysaccharide heptosyltransferase II [Zooshikella ganghwensis]MBU2706251.1 lipopolysaccharide heptosyltransferase II [Zooshikella ganghwensis]
MKILVVGPSWVGDMVMAQTLFMSLKAQHPDCVIDVLAPEWSRPILQRMPEVHKSIAMPVGHGQLKLSARWHLARKLRYEHYDQAIVLPNSLKSVLVPAMAKIPQRTGWVGECRYGLLNDIRKLDKSALPLMIQRFIALAYPANTPLSGDLPAPALHVDKVSLQKALARYELMADESSPVLALCPGAEFGPAKRWPEQHYSAVATHMIQAGWQVWLLGSAKDQEVTAKIASQIPEQWQNQVQNLAGRTSLAEAIDLLSMASAVVSNDSGLMHIAAALERPLVVVYGSTSPDFTPPLNQQQAVVRLGLECSPCFKRECPLGHLKCLHQLTPPTVIEALQRLVPVVSENKKPAKSVASSCG